ncbi:MAG: DoxX family membrane protein [Chitinophagales bacterium]
MLLSSSNNRAVGTARIFLGLIYFVFGLNFFLHFIPGSAQPEGKAAAFVGGLFQSGYFFPMIKAIEVLAGALLILGFFTPLLLVILMPITINILLFHTALAPGGFPTTLSLLMIITHLFLAWSYRNHYKPLFVPRPAN